MFQAFHKVHDLWQCTINLPIHLVEQELTISIVPSIHKLQQRSAKILVHARLQPNDNDTRDDTRDARIGEKTQERQ